MAYVESGRMRTTKDLPVEYIWFQMLDIQFLNPMVYGQDNPSPGHVQLPPRVVPAKHFARSTGLTGNRIPIVPSGSITLMFRGTKDLRRLR